MHFYTISSLYVLNCFRYLLIYILRQNAAKIKQEKLSQELYKVFISQVVLNFFQCIFWDKNV